MLKILMGIAMGLLFVRRLPTLVTARLSSNNLVSAHAVSNGNPTPPPAQATPVVVNVYLPPQAQVSSIAQPASANPQVPAATAASVTPPPPAPLPVIWPFVALVAILMAVMAVFWVGYITDPMRDIDAVMVMGGNEVERPEFIRFVRSGGAWMPEIRYDYTSTVHSLQDVGGAQFHVASGWEMQTITPVGVVTTFREGERHRVAYTAVFHRRDGDIILTLQQWFHR